jgi:D-alanyl-D-alanine carboxypeptidase/D-alanyl-D-alanine-endopeptidase (penicillin-binding protein 4)
VLLDEGSGLSRGCLVTAAASVQLLTYMGHHRCRDAFVDALPIAGVDGTLSNRFKETAAAGNARAKTGTLRHVNAISGYVTSAAGEKLVFSVMLNNYQARSASAASAPETDAIVRMLAEWTGQ